MEKYSKEWKIGLGEKKEIGDDFWWKTTYVDEKWFSANKVQIGDDFWLKVTNADEKGFLANEDRIGDF